MTTIIKNVLTLSAATLLGFAGAVHAASDHNLGDPSYQISFQIDQAGKTKASVRSELQNHRLTMTPQGGDGTALPAWMSDQRNLSQQEVAKQLLEPLNPNQNHSN